MSKPNLPPLPDLPEKEITDVICNDDGDEWAVREWLEEDLRAWATAYAEEAVRQALAAQSASLRAFADRQYCIAMAHANRNGCLGWEEKVKKGTFGVYEYVCHKNMHEATGAHFGIYEALKEADAPPEPRDG